MSIVRWEPITEVMSLGQAMDRLFEDSFFRPSHVWSGLSAGEPAIDMYQGEDSVVVKASLPGLKPEEINISITGDTLTIRGEHKEEREVKEEDYLHRELRTGSFSRLVTIPVKVDGGKAEATFEDGILKIVMPKAEGLKTRTVKVKTIEKGTEGK